MQIEHSLEQPLTNRPVVLTIGKFDGFHLGHQALIRTATERARARNFASAVLTFDPHPGQVLSPERNVRLLTSINERIEMIGSYDPDLLIIVPFTRTMMNTSAEECMRKICHALPLRELWTGANFVLGRNREGTLPRLIDIGRDMGYTVGSLAPVMVEGVPVSSSRVRRLLSDGIVETLSALMGRPYGIVGRVVQGDGRGRTIGVPTANLAVDPLRALPASGVYACCARTERAPDTPVPAVVNIGTRPTFGGEEQTIEAHLLDWNGNLYGQTLRLAFWQRLRGERKFGHVNELVAQIQRDIARAREVLGSNRAAHECSAHVRAPAWR